MKCQHLDRRKLCWEDDLEFWNWCSLCLFFLVQKHIWWNSYHRRKWTQRLEFKSWTWLFTSSCICECLDPSLPALLLRTSISLPSLRSMYHSSGLLFKTIWATSLPEGKSEFKIWGSLFRRICCSILQSSVV